VSSDPAKAISTYDARAGHFASLYEGVSSEEIWGPLGDLIAAGPQALALDIGAGSGRDAAWLSSRGFDVVAAEPAAGMRREGQRLHAGLRWISDRLPDLSSTHRLGFAFDLILMSGVWMHLPAAERPRAFRKVVTLLKPGGLLIMSLRHGPGDPERPTFPTSLGEIEQLARDHGLAVVRALERPAALATPGVTWTSVCLRLPDDGAASLPLIRGIILNDSKSSTYKLALLRAVAKVADLAPSLAISDPEEPDRVLIPMGLVALNWVRSYLPLLAKRLPQAPKNHGPDGLGFAKDGFRALSTLRVAPQDLRVGGTFLGERAAALSAALTDARRTILDMPVVFTTWPNSTNPVFAGIGRADRPRGDFILTEEVLWNFGSLAVPGSLWRTMQRLGAWIEPVLTSEWARLTRGYASRLGLAVPPGEVEQCLEWLEPRRDTSEARAVALKLVGNQEPLRCVWSGETLRAVDLDVDHALPWSAWPCSDLWNLMPCSRRVNQHQKRDRLPSAAALACGSVEISNWWQRAWLENPGYKDRFWIEARAALPIDGEPDITALLGGLEWRRLRLQQDQQISEWTPTRSRPE
jgi:SAM-dependent methyltransferase